MSTEANITLGHQVANVINHAIQLAVFIGAWVWLGFWIALLISVLTGIAVMVLVYHNCTTRGLDQPLITNERAEQLGAKAYAIKSRVTGFFAR